jgi:hypothetical protein
MLFKIIAEVIGFRETQQGSDFKSPEVSLDYQQFAIWHSFCWNRVRAHPSFVVHELITPEALN